MIFKQLYETRERTRICALRVPRILIRYKIYFCATTRMVVGSIPDGAHWNFSVT